MSKPPAPRALDKAAILWHNSRVKEDTVSHRARRWLLFLLAMAFGLGLGLYYGWVLNPVRYVNTTPATLRLDYKTDFVLMVAEGYRLDGDLNLARYFLAPLGEEPEAMVAKALAYATQLGYASPDLLVMRDLLRDLRQSSGGGP